MAKPKLKTGTFTSFEKQYIADNMGKMSLEELAEKMNRSVHSIGKQVSDITNIKVDKKVLATVEEKAIVNEFEQSIAWRQLKDEFEPDEQKFFMEKYAQLVRQFESESVMATEDTQICQSIKLEILMHRNLVKQKEIEKDKEFLESRRRQYQRNMFDDAAEMAKYQELSIMIAEKDGMLQSKVKEWGELDSNHGKIMGSLKATRKDRIDKIKDKTTTMLDLIKQLDQEDTREREGRMMESMRIATDKEMVRLGKENEYIEGDVDRPLLNSDTVMMEEEE